MNKWHNSHFFLFLRLMIKIMTLKYGNIYIFVIFKINYPSVNCFIYIDHNLNN